MVPVPYSSDTILLPHPLPLFPLPPTCRTRFNSINGSAGACTSDGNKSLHNPAPSLSPSPPYCLVTSTHHVLPITIITTPSTTLHTTTHSSYSSPPLATQPTPTANTITTTATSSSSSPPLPPLPTTTANTITTAATTPYHPTAIFPINPHPHTPLHTTTARTTTTATTSPYHHVATTPPTTHTYPTTTVYSPHASTPPCLPPMQCCYPLPSLEIVPGSRSRKGAF